MPNKFLLPITILTSVVLSVVLCFFIFSNSSSDVVYVDNEILFEQFKMTKELKKEGEKTLLLQKKKIDSLQILVATDLTEAEKEDIVRKIIEARQQLEFFEQNFVETNSEKIWERIHIYTKEFVKEHDYQLIIGSQYKSDILYSSKELDITQLMLDFINNKYEGL